MNRRQIYICLRLWEASGGDNIPEWQESECRGVMRPLPVASTTVVRGEDESETSVLACCLPDAAQLSLTADAFFGNKRPF